MRQSLGRAVDALRYAPWLTRDRLLRWGAVGAFVTIGVFALIVACTTAASGFTDAAGQYLGRDFYTFWSSARLLAAGHPAAAYVVGPHHSIDHAMPYPPSILLLCRPLAGLPFARAYFAWLGLGIAIFAYPLARAVGWQTAMVAAIGTPAALINILLGQTGYYTGALLVWGLALAGKSPLRSGILLGLLGCKPQIGLLLVVALAGGRHWRVLGSAAATSIVLVAVSASLLGPHSWIIFFDRLVVQRQFMETHVAAWPWMPTVFAMMRLAGAATRAAYLAQVISAICAAFAVAVLWREPCPLKIKSAGLTIAVFLATPYAWDYDAVVLSFAAAWLAKDGVNTGFQPWEKMTVLVLLIFPALSVIPAKLLDLQIAPVLLWLSLAVVMRRGLAATRLRRADEPAVSLPGQLSGGEPAAIAGLPLASNQRPVEG